MKIPSKRHRKSLNLGPVAYKKWLAEYYAKSREAPPAWVSPDCRPQCTWHANYVSRRNADPHAGERRQCLLSILVPTLPSRLSTYAPLIAELDRQAAGKPVEIISICDNRYRTTGEKRNEMLRMAKGVFVSHIDDDDWISPFYADRILAAVSENPAVDAFGFDIEILPRRGRAKIVHYNPSNAPSHIGVWRASMARSYFFSHVSVADDCDWVARISLGAKVFVRIPEVLYHYRVGRNESWGNLPGGVLGG